MNKKMKMTSIKTVNLLSKKAEIIILNKIIFFCNN